MAVMDHSPRLIVVALRIGHGSFHVFVEIPTLVFVDRNHHGHKLTVDLHGMPVIAGFSSRRYDACSEQAGGDIAHFVDVGVMEPDD